MTHLNSARTLESFKINKSFFIFISFLKCSKQWHTPESIANSITAKIKKKKQPSLLLMRALNFYFCSIRCSASIDRRKASAQQNFFNAELNVHNVKAKEINENWNEFKIHKISLTFYLILFLCVFFFFFFCEKQMFD